MEGAVIGDEVLAIAGKASEAVERLQGLLRRILDGFRDAGRLQRQAKPQQVARVGKRDRIDAIALARLHGDEMLALQPQQGLADRLAADGIAFGELLLAHVVAGRQPAAQNISAQAFIDVVAQKHECFPRDLATILHS